MNGRTVNHVTTSFVDSEGDGPGTVCRVRCDLSVRYRGSPAGQKPLHLVKL